MNDLVPLNIPREYPGQMEIKFPKKFNSKKMGYVCSLEPGKAIYLNSSFISKELGLGGMGNIDNISLGKNTEVFCPFCNNGHIRLKSITPLYSSGSANMGPRYHVGNYYEFDCSAEYGAIFLGSIEWMHIF